MKRIIFSLSLLLFMPGMYGQTGHITLEECQQKTQDNYPLVRQYDLVEKTKEYNLENAARGYLPQFALSAKASYQSDVTELPIAIPGVDIKGMAKDQYQVMLELQQQIWDGGGIRMQKKKATAEAEIDREKLNVDMYALNGRVNDLYFGILMLDEQLAQNALLQDELGRNFRQITAYVENGYPLGVVGVILAIVFIRKLFVRPADMPEPDAEHRKNVFIASYHLTNPAVFGKSVHEIAAQSHHHFVISRVWREGKVSIPTSDKTLQKDDVILVITTPGEADALRLIFGEQEQKDWNTENIDWNAVDSQLISQRILVTRPEINGKKLSSLRLRNNYGINISRVYRSGVQLLATPDLRLQMGDRLTVVGEAAAIKHVEKILGNAVKNLEEPNLVAVFVGLILGLTLGSIPVSIPGISLPVKLGLAGGPIIVGILIGTFGPRLHMITYTTYSANLMLRALGLSMYLACLGLEAGTHFFETVMRPEGALWLLLGFLLTFVPVVLLGIFALRILRIDFGSVAGMLCGSMANPMALNYANDTIEGDNPSVSYATVYPLCMFLRVIIIQVMLMIFL